MLLSLSILVKQASISILFLLAFFVIIAHDIIPHSHDHEVTLKVHEHDSERHGHDHEDDGENDDSDLTNAFSFFKHTNSRGNEYSVPGSIRWVGYKLIKPQILQSLQFDLVCVSESPPLLAVQRYDPLLAQSAIPYFFSLKAPPYINYCC